MSLKLENGQEPFAKAQYYMLLLSMAAAISSLCLWKLFIVTLISLALAKDEIQFIYHGFNNSKLHLDGLGQIHSNGLLQLTNSTQLQSGHAFYPFPLKFNTSSSHSISFSTHFVFSIAPSNGSGGHGMAFVISPSTDFTTAFATEYLGLLNYSNNGLPTNHIIAVELDIVQSIDFSDINGNHVGINVNDLKSNESAPAGYFSDAGKNISLFLQCGKPIQIWIDYNGEEKLLNVTLASVTIPKPSRPLLSTPIDLSQIFMDSMYFGFSASTGILASNHSVLGWSFNRSGKAQNLDISRLPKLPPSPSTPPSSSFSAFAPPPEKPKEKPSPLIIVLPIVGWLVVVLITISGVVYIAWKKKYEEVCEDWEREYGPQRFSYRNLYKATKGFRELLGKGGFGKVYKGVLSSPNLEIAVKRISHDSEQGMKEFVSEIASMGSLRHRNLVQLRGYCRRRGELLLVYDYMPNRSLDTILHSSTKPNLSWFQRFRILRGVASALLYLHEEWEQVVLHRDIKPGNILLDADMNGKLADFGMARLYDHGSILQTTNLVGTPGYLAPELPKTGKADTSTDVLAFGVCMLEVACGRRPIEDGKPYLVDWVINCWKRGSILDVTDPRLDGLYVEEQVELVLKLGLFCSHPNPVARPNMRQVMQYLDGNAQFPEIPPDSFVISVSTTETNEASEDVTSFLALLRNISCQTTSTIDSILLEGR